MNKPSYKILKFAKRILEVYNDGTIYVRAHTSPGNRKRKGKWVTKNPTHNGQAYQNKRQGTTSQYRGVHWHITNKKWCATITHHQKVLNIGSFSKEIDAAKAFNKKAEELGWPVESLNTIK